MYLGTEVKLKLIKGRALSSDTYLKSKIEENFLRMDSNCHQDVWQQCSQVTNQNLIELCSWNLNEFNTFMSLLEYFDGLQSGTDCTLASLLYLAMPQGTGIYDKVVTYMYASGQNQKDVLHETFDINFLKS